MASEPPILIWTPGGGVPSPPVWPPPTGIVYPECGRAQLVSGQNWIDVTFTDPKPDANWIFTDLQVVNTVDAGPFNIAPGIVTDKTITGFRLQLNGLPNTDNYFLHWAVGGCGTSAAWVVNSGLEATNFLQLTDTPDDYTGQSGKGVKVNATEDGLEFGSSGGGIEGPVFNVLDYGAKADCVTLFDITMPIGAVVTSAAYTFTEADIGKTAVIRGAINAGVSPMVATIISVSGHTATLDKATTIGLTTEAHSFPRMDFGTDNTQPFVFACLAVPGPGNRDHYESIPFAAAGTMNPVLAGDGGVVYIPRGNYLLPQIYTYPFWFFETNNVHIKGDGMGATVLFYGSNTTGCLVCGSFASHGLFQNVTISDFTVWDLNFYSGGGNAIYVFGTDNTRIERIESVNSRGNGGIAYQGLATGGEPVNKRLYIRDCWVHGNHVDTTNTYPNGIEGDGMNVGEVMDVHIENNTIEGTGRHGYEGGGNCRDQYFIGNTVNQAGRSGINPTGGGRTVVIGNTVNGFGIGTPGSDFGIDFTTDVGAAYTANDTRVIGNWVKGNGQAGFRFQNTSGDLTVPHVDHIILANNWVEGDANPAMAGVYLGEYSPSVLIEGNWFNIVGAGVTAGASFVAATGKYIIIKNNFFAGLPLQQIQLGNIIIENNTVPPDLNYYSGSSLTCSIDGQTVLAGAINTATNVCQGARLTDSVEIVRGATTAPQLIMWGVVTSVAAFNGTITTYAYNPTGGSLGTGATTKFIVHRPIPP